MKGKEEKEEKEREGKKILRRQGVFMARLGWWWHSRARLGFGNSGDTNDGSSGGIDGGSPRKAKRSRK